MSAQPAPVTTQTGGFALVPIWVLQLGLTGAELAVYVALRSFADQAGHAYPHVRTIAARAGVSERTTERALALFRRRDLVRTTQRQGPGGSVIGCDYHLRDVPIDRPADATPGATQSPGPPTRMSPPPDEDVATPPTRVSGPIEELTIEHTNGTSTALAAPDGAAAKRPRGTRLPDGWFPTKADHTWFEAECPRVDFRTETQKFRNHWAAKTGRDATKLNWSATWRNWMLNARDRYGGARASPPPNGFDKEAAMARARERDAREEASR